jgi:spermidine/putrescine transport system permease protein
VASTLAPEFKKKWRAPKFALAIPSIVWYTAFFIAPIAIVVVYSFMTKDSSKRIPIDYGHLTTRNYSNALSGPFARTFWRTIRIAVTATTLCIVIGFPVAYFLAFKVSEKWRALLLAAVVIPSFTSFLIRTLAWEIPLAPNGFLSHWLQNWGFIDKPLSVLQTATAVQLAIVYNYLGFVILPLFVALDRIDIRMREASKDLGAGRWATFFGVTLPLAWPGIVAAVLLTYIPMAGDYVTATVLGGAKGNMLGALIASQFQGAQNWPAGSAMAVLMIVAIVLTLGAGAVLLAIVKRVTRSTSPWFDGLRRSLHERRMRSSLAHAADTTHFPDLVPLALGLVTLAVLVFMFIPIVLVFVYSFNSGSSLVIWRGFSTQWWGRLFVGSKSVHVLLTFAIIVAVGIVLPRLVRLVTSQRRPVLERWTGPAFFLLAIVYTGETTNWYRDVFNDANVGDAMRNSFLAASGATAIAVLIGGLAGTALARRPGKWTVVFMSMVFLILVTPEIMEAISLATWFPRFTWSPFMKNVGPLRFGINRLWVGQSLYSSAVVTLIVRARLQGLDESLEEAAGDLGAPPARAFRQITLPLIASALLAGALLSFTLCIDNTVVSALISNAGSSTFPVALLSSLRSTIKPFWGVGAIVLFMTTMSALAYVGYVLKKSGESSSQIAATLGGAG